MWKSFCILIKKDIRMLVSGRFFLLAAGSLMLYTAYVNLGYTRFMKMPIYNVYLYDPAGTLHDISPQIHAVSSREELNDVLLSDANAVGIISGAGSEDGTTRIVLYKSTTQIDRHRADYALSLLGSPVCQDPEVTGTGTPEQKARKEITCELLFFELTAVGFLGIAAVLFREKNMGVLHVHAVLPLQKPLFLLSKLIVFLLSDLAFAILLTLLNVGILDGVGILTAVLLQTAVLSLIMALTGLLCAMLLRDFRQFTLIYLVITVFAATPVFLSANTSIKFDWICWHPFYHLYMGLKHAFFKTSAVTPAYVICTAGMAGLLSLCVLYAFHREIRKEG